jgi:hypothetical protein
MLYDLLKPRAQGDGRHSSSRYYSASLCLYPAIRGRNHLHDARHANAYKDSGQGGIWPRSLNVTAQQIVQYQTRERDHQGKERLGLQMTRYSNENITALQKKNVRPPATHSSSSHIDHGRQPKRHLQEIRLKKRNRNTVQSMTLFV